MTIKIPPFFKKGFSENDFRKKILGKTFSEQDNSYLSGLFAKNADNKFVVKRELTKEDIKKCAHIIKTIKGNTGVVLKGRFIIIGVIIAAIVVFNILFRDMLMERALEYALESIFSAKADVSAFVFDPFAGIVRMTHVEVADKDKPFINLFELGITEVRIDTIELLKGKYIIKNIECQNIAWATPRKISGALIPSPSSASQNPGAGKSKEMTFPSFSFKGLDAAGIIESQKTNFKSLPIIENSNAVLTETYGKWEGKTEEYKISYEATSKAVNKALAINVKNIKTPQDAQAAAALVDTAVKTSGDSVKLFSEATSSIGKDVEVITGEKRKVEEAIGADYDFVYSFVNIPEGGAKNLASSLAERLIAANVGDLYRYAMIGLDALRNLQPESKQKKAQPKTARRTGINVQFPGNHYPQFLLERAAFSIMENGTIGQVAANVENVSSAPDLIGAPVTFGYTQDGGGQGLSVNGMFDVRKEAGKSAEFSLDMSGLPYASETLLSPVGIGGMNCVAAIGAIYAQEHDGAVSGTIDITIRKVVAPPIDPSDRIARILSEILMTSDAISMQARYAIKDGTPKISVTSTIDRIIADSIGKLIDETIADAKKSLKQEFDKYVQKELSENEALLKSIDDVEKSINNYSTQLAGSNSALSKKQKEIEAQIKKSVGGDAMKSLDNLLKF